MAASVRRQVEKLVQKAYKSNGEAQYELAMMYFESQSSSDEDEDLKRLDSQVEVRPVDDNNAQNIKDIRLYARREFKKYLLQEKRRAELVEQQNSIVQRTKIESLDLVYGAAHFDTILNPDVAISHNDTPADSIDLEIRKLDHVVAAKWLRRAAVNGVSDANVQLGNLAIQHDPPLVDNALHWYSTAEKHPDAFYNLGLLYYNGCGEALVQDRLKALEFFHLAARENDPSALFWLGHVYRVGDSELDIVPSFDKALEYLNRASSLDHTGACYYLAQLYRSGDPEYGFEQNTPLFWKYLTQAVELGDPDALYCVGDIYYHGTDGKTRDNDRALEYFRQSAASGHKDALCCLGSIYYQSQQYTRAFRYYQAAADRHSMEAWKNLAQMYLLGHGVVKSKETADSIIEMLKKNGDNIRLPE